MKCDEEPAEIVRAVRVISWFKKKQINYFSSFYQVKAYNQLFLVTNQWLDLSREQLPHYEEKLTTNYPVVQAIPLLSLWYLFKSSCARRSVFLCNSCFQQGSEYTQMIKNWFPWILIHNQCCNQQLWNEKRQPLFICCLYNVALSMLDEFAFMRRKQLPISIITFMFWKKLLQIIIIYRVV